MCFCREAFHHLNVECHAAFHGVDVGEQSIIKTLPATQPMTCHVESYSRNQDKSSRFNGRRAQPGFRFRDGKFSRSAIIVKCRMTNAS